MCEQEPWWRVDLGSHQSVSAVIMKNREDCCGQRLEKAKIHVGDSLDDHGKQNPICGTITNTTLGSISTVPCNGLEGRYVTIVIPDRRGILTLCEVEVVAQGCPQSPVGYNLAREQPVSQSSTFNQHEPEKAVDGKCDGILDHGFCSHTQGESDPWWNVDLGSRYSVSTVIVKNRADCCGERLKGAQIHVGDSKGGQGNCGTITDTAPGSLSTISCDGKKGRYVTITIPNRVEYLTLCEVEVYGTLLWDDCY
nr:fucolectin-4-like [Chelonoidis abingdonii]